MKSQTGSPISLPSNASVSNNNEALENSASSPSTNTASGAHFRGAGGGGGAGSSSPRQDGGGQGSASNAAAEGTINPFAFLCSIFTSLLLTAQSFFNSTARELQQQREEHKHLFNRIIRNGSVRGAGVVADYGHNWSSSAGSFGSSFPLQQYPANFQNASNYQQVALDQSFEGHLGRQGQGGTQFASASAGPSFDPRHVPQPAHGQGASSDGDQGHWTPQVADSSVSSHAAGGTSGAPPRGHSAGCPAYGCGQGEKQGSADFEGVPQSSGSVGTSSVAGNGDASVQNSEQNRRPHAASTSGPHADTGGSSGAIQLDKAKSGGGKTSGPPNPGRGPAVVRGRVGASLKPKANPVDSGSQGGSSSQIVQPEDRSDGNPTMAKSGSAKQDQKSIHASQLQTGSGGTCMAGGGGKAHHRAGASAFPEAQGCDKRAGVLSVSDARGESRGVFGLARDAPAVNAPSACDIRGDQSAWAGKKFFHETSRSNIRYSLGRRNRLSKVAYGKQLQKPLHAKKVDPMHFDRLMNQMAPQVARRITGLMLELQNAQCDNAQVDAKFRASSADVELLKSAGVLENTEFTGSAFTSVRYFTVFEAIKDRRRPIMWPWMFLLNSDYHSEFSLSNVSQYCNAVFDGKHACAFDLSASFWQVVLEGCNFVMQDESGKRWRITRLPFGVDCASEIMQLIVEQLGAIAKDRAGLSGKSVSLYVHIDNVLCIGSKADVQKWRQAFLEVCQSFNVTLNDEPENNAVSQRVEFAGIKMNFRKKNVRPRDAFIDSLPSVEVATLSFTSLESCIGKVMHGIAIRQLPMSRFHSLLKWWRNCLSQLSRHKLSWGAHPRMPEPAREDLKQSLEMLADRTSVKVRKSPVLKSDDITPDDVANDAIPTLVVDATLHSYGGVLYERGHVVAAFGERFSKQARSMGLAEIAAAQAMIQYFASRLRGRHFILLTDNTSCETGIRKGASSHLDMDRAAYAIHKLLSTIGAKVHVAHIDTEDNVADAISRLRPLDESKIDVSKAYASQALELLVGSGVGDSVRKVVMGGAWG